jgi:predicted CXXCH cytochrome family protein
MKKIIVLMLLVVLVTPAFIMAANTHTATGTKGYHCKTCHTVHNSNPNAVTGAIPLWAGNDPNYVAVSFTMYTTKVHTTQATKPDGASKICMSCHDGSGTFDSSNITDGSNADLSTDISNMHPISFVYNATATGYVDRGSLDTGLIDSANKVQCTSCHEVHKGAAGEYALRYAASASDSTLCGKCHIK